MLSMLRSLWERFDHLVVRHDWESFGAIRKCKVCHHMQMKRKDGTYA